MKSILTLLLASGGLYLIADNSDLLAAVGTIFYVTAAQLWVRMADHE